MIPTPQEFPKAFVVWFKDLERWDPASFHVIQWHWPKEVMLPLGRFLKVRKEKVDRSQIAFSELQPITIHFDGSIDRRKIDGAREYTMDLYSAKPRDIVVAKIDLKNGAVGIVPHDWQNVAVTGHFAVYEPDRSRLLPEYLHRIIQTNFFKAHLWRNKVGAEGRKEVKLDYFESLQIPIPPLPIQQAIVDRWKKAQDEIRVAKEHIKHLNESIDEEFLNALGLKTDIKHSHNKMFVVWWNQLLRWDVVFAQNLGMDYRSSLYKNLTIADVIQPLKDTTKRTNPNTVPDEEINYIGLANVEASTGRLINFLPVSEEDIDSSCVIFDEDHVLYAKLRPYLRKTIVPSKFGLSSGIASSEFLTIKPLENISRDFLALYLRSSAVAMQARQAIGARMPRISTDALLSFTIPLPTISIQHKMIESTNKIELEIDREREAAELRARDIKTEIEALILGIKSIDVVL